MATVQPGAVIGGRYRLERPIGSGGMAKVWLAHDRLLDRPVAVKILSERYAADPDFVERFRREASAAAGLSHPNIVTVYDRGEAEGSYYIVMEHLPGPDLKEILRRRGRLDARQAVDAALQVLAALSAAHRRDVIHRDIKPQNVLVAEDGHLKVTDFGIARAGDDAGMTEVGSVIGTAQYLSPEQARGDDVTTASDCYAVGIVLYEMLTGRVPFDGEKPVAVAMRQVNETPIAPHVVNPAVPVELSDIVMKALEKRPGSRYRTAEEFSDALLQIRPLLPPPVEDATAVLAAVDPPETTTRIIPGPPRPPTGPTRMAGSPPPPPRRRSRAPLIAALVALLLLAAGAYALFFTDLVQGGTVTIPELQNRNAADARAQLEELGLQVSPQRETSDAVAEGNVTRTDPPGGSRVDEGSEVTLFVSAGPETKPVPDVVGRSREDAESALSREGFTVKVLEENDDDVAAGDVIRQTPGAGEQHAVGGEVTIVVSLGPEPVEVPQLLLKTEAQARELLADAGLELGNVTTRETTRREPGLILDQDPDAGAKIPPGRSVGIVVAKAPPAPPQPQTTAMPDVIGNNVAAARQKLQNNGFADATAGPASCAEPEFTVVGQDPPPGTQVDPANQAVNLTVSDGTGATPCIP